MELIFASNNSYKLKEIALLLPSSVKIKSLADIHCNEELPETGNTIESNALQKAKHLALKYNVNCFADDTGLEVEALNGNPGVYSARYAGLQKNASDNMDKLLDELKNNTNRKARFKTIVALMLSGKEFLFEGFINGHIGYTKQGNEGFGYDPIFIPDGCSKTFAQMSREEKNKMSHRAMAIRKLVEFIKTQF